jgi:NAD(P)-dependent dehydrogenase (short-subunit alcohol dehydrogenase family)
MLVDRSTGGSAGARIPDAGELEELAAAIVFLASDAASYCSGTELTVDGGYTAGHITPGSSVADVARPAADPRRSVARSTASRATRADGTRWTHTPVACCAALIGSEFGGKMAISDVSHQPLAELVSLQGRAAVVTGGARGIGRAIAARFAEAGAAVALGDLDGALAAKAAADLQARHDRPVIAVPTDVRDATAVRELADAAERELGPIGIWVNNAGIFPSSGFLDIAHDEWDRVMDLNVRGVFLCSQEIGRRMAQRGRGVIVNIASTGAFKTGPGVAHYITSKHAVVGLTKALAVELGPLGIRVLGVAPSMTRTEGRDEFLAAHLPPGMEDFVKEMEERPPLGRIGVPDDVARVVLFCACDLSLLMTGSTLLVDAGEGVL